MVASVPQVLHLCMGSAVEGVAAEGVAGEVGAVEGEPWRGWLGRGGEGLKVVAMEGVALKGVAVEGGGGVLKGVAVEGRALEGMAVEKGALQVVACRPRELTPIQVTMSVGMTCYGTRRKLVYHCGGSCKRSVPATDSDQAHMAKLISA